MTEIDKPARPGKPWSQKILSWWPYIAIPLVVYFGNVELQSYLGRQALEKTGLTHHSIEQAIDIAQKSNKPILADVSAIWCPTCRKLDQEVLADPEVKQTIEDNYVFSRIEYESEEAEAFMKKHNVRGFPTLLILNSDGEKIKNLPLTFSPKEFIALIAR